MLPKPDLSRDAILYKIGPINKKKIGICPSAAISRRVPSATDVVQAREGGRTRRRSLGRTGETTEAEARALARRWFLDRRERGTPPAVRSVVFPVFAEEFLSGYRRNWKPGTYAVSLAILRREILPFFAERNVGNIARTDVAGWFAGMAARPGLAILDRLSNNGPHVFPDRAGRGPMTRASLHAFWRPLRERCGFPDVRLHDLRHTFASIAVQNGIPLATVGRLLGHRLGETTLKYVHLSDDGPRAAAVVSSGIAAIPRKGTGR